VPSCGTIGTFCGVTVDCCAASAICAYGAPGGTSYDCPKCCERSCCNPSEIPESTCSDGADNDCDNRVDCADADCDGQYCAFMRTCSGGACVT
jgi:hypothetical protein